MSLQTPDWNEYEQNKSECTACTAGDQSIGTMTMTILKIYWTDKSLDWLNRHKTLWTVLFRTEWLFRKGPSCQPDFIYVQSKYVFCYLSSHNWGPFFKFANKYVQLTLNIHSLFLVICNPPVDLYQISEKSVVKLCPELLQIHSTYPISTQKTKILDK